MKRISGPLAIITIVICTLIAGSFVAWQYKKIEDIRMPGIEIQEEKVGKKIKEEEVREELISEETADWELYQDDDFGFEVKVAPFWKIPKEQPSKALNLINFPSQSKKNSANLGVSIYHTGMKLALKDTESWKDYSYKDEYGTVIKTKDFTKEKITINDLSGYKFYFLEQMKEEFMGSIRETTTKNIIYLLGRDSKILRIWYTSDDFSLEEFEKNPNQDRKHVENLRKMIETLKLY